MARRKRWLIHAPNTKHGLHLDSYISNLPPNTDRTVFAGLIHHLRTVEREQRVARTRMNRGHFEGRSWHGFHHHAVLSMLAWEFLKRHPEHAT